MDRTLGLSALGLIVAWGAAAHAQTPPKFEYGKPEEVKGVEWKATGSAGMILTTGNARSLALSGSLNASRRAGDDKVSFEANGAYARSEVLVAVDSNMNGTIGPDEITRDTQTTARNWLFKLRYDRFFAGPNSAFVSARLGSDEPSGKQLFGGFQIGYSRILFKDDVHELTGELGYDFTYESYVANADNLAIHSLRAFAGYNAKLSEDTAFLANIEALFNLNGETGPKGDISPFEDTRFIAKAGLTTKLWKRVDFRFTFTAKFDNAPAPLPTFKVPYDPGFLPLADKLDAITEAALIVSFL